MKDEKELFKAFMGENMPSFNKNLKQFYTGSTEAYLLQTAPNKFLTVAFPFNRVSEGKDFWAQKHVEWVYVLSMFNKGTI